MRYPARVLRQARAEIRKVVRADTVVHGRLRDRIVAIFLATLAVDAICAVLAYVFEHNQKGSEIHSFGTALFWTTTQLLTVSSQMPNPLSTGGRLLDVFMEAWAVTVVASLAAAVGAFFVHSHDQPDARNPSDGLG